MSPLSTQVQSVVLFVALLTVNSTLSGGQQLDLTRRGNVQSLPQVSEKVLLSGNDPSLVNSSYNFCAAPGGLSNLGGIEARSLQTRETCSDIQRPCYSGTLSFCCPVVYNCVYDVPGGGCCEIPSNAYCPGFGCFDINSYECCPNGGQICLQGETCMPDPYISNVKCCFEDWVVCGNDCIDPTDEFCCGGTNGCDSDQVCCGSTCCDYGYVCGVGNECTWPEDSSASSTSMMSTSTSNAADATGASGGGGGGSTGSQNSWASTTFDGVSLLAYTVVGILSWILLY